ncbi:hypothetical protein HG530_000255 [Fusarium avenaceum]|nr:hypothetical protein HG530_000255 [Fusarium avenaceum]
MGKSLVATVVCVGDIGKLILNLGNTCGHLVAASVEVRLLDFLGLDLLLQSRFVILERLLCCLENLFLAAILLLDLLLAFAQFGCSIKVLELLSKLLGLALGLGFLGLLLTNFLSVLFIVVSSRSELIVCQLIVLSQSVGAVLVLLPQSLEARLLLAELGFDGSNRRPESCGRRIRVKGALSISDRRRNTVRLTLSGLDSSDAGCKQDRVSLAIDEFTDIFGCRSESVDIARPSHTFMRFIGRLLDRKHACTVDAVDKPASVSGVANPPSLAKEPYQEEEEIHTQDSHKGRHGRIAVKNFGEVDAHTRACGNGRNKGKEREDGDDEDGERVLHGERLENSGCEVEYTRVTMDIGILHGIDIDLAMASVDATEAIGIGRIGRHFGNSVERGAAVVVADFV